MPPSSTIIIQFSSRILLRRSTRTALRRRYSTASSEPIAPLVRVTDIPAPSTGHIRILELNRPAARNAISRDLLSAFRSQIDAIHAQYDAETGEEVPVRSWNKRFGGAAGEDAKGPTRAVIVASAVDSCFCAGADLKERRTMSGHEVQSFLSDLRSTFTSLSSLPIPTISAVSSLALGGGFELALSTHFRVLASTATVGLPETRLGIIPGAGGTHRLPALIGIAKARDLILTGRRVSAAEAYFLGIVERLVEVLPASQEEQTLVQGELEEDRLARYGAELLSRARRDALSEAVRLASEICEGAPIAVRAALQAVQRPHESVENAMYDRVVKTEDRDEALYAFAQKRKPAFTGR